MKDFLHLRVSAAESVRQSGADHRLCSHPQSQAEDFSQSTPQDHLLLLHAVPPAQNEHIQSLQNHRTVSAGATIRDEVTI